MIHLHSYRLPGVCVSQTIYCIVRLQRYMYFVRNFEEIVYCFYLKNIPDLYVAEHYGSPGGLKISPREVTTFLHTTFKIIK
jgi:hypothetical protein